MTATRQIAAAQNNREGSWCCRQVKTANMTPPSGGLRQCRPIQRPARACLDADQGGLDAGDALAGSVDERERAAPGSSDGTLAAVVSGRSCLQRGLSRSTGGPVLRGLTGSMAEN